MKFITASFLTATLAFTTALFFPWWMVAVVAFIVALLVPQKSLLAFLSAALAIFFLWGIQAFLIDKRNNHVLATKVAELITHKRSFGLMIVITAFVGAIVSGFAASTGSLLRQVYFDNTNQRKGYNEN
jgi:predicted PurR-regulated permease PerM